MATGIELFNQLDEKPQRICNALDALNTVISGDAFDRAQIWIPGEVDELVHPTVITNYLQGLPVINGLEQAANDLFAGLPTGELKNAVDTAIDEVEKLLLKAASARDDLVGNRLEAFNKLNNPTNDTDHETAPYGFFPAIEDVINAAADTQLDIDKALAPLAAINAALNSGAAYALFVAYAGGSIAQITKAVDTEQDY